jgi:type II restriction/modification system DNA methylase subunit YeeA
MYIAPLAIPEKPRNESISELVDSILSATSKDPKANVSKLERQIDQLVYQLYGLTEEEIAVVEGKSQ